MPGVTDNFVITEGSGTTIASDYLAAGPSGAGHVQYVKLINGAAGDTTPWNLDVSGALPVSIAAIVQVAQKRASTATRSSVAASATSVQLLAANASRLDSTIYNDSSAILYVALGTVAATLTNFTVPVAANGYYEVAYGYTGAIQGIWASAVGNARITELT